jgi:cell division cycle 14
MQEGDGHGPKPAGISPAQGRAGGRLVKRRNLGPGVFSLLPEEYVPIFKQLGVTVIVRFNNKCYDKAVFERSGIKHVDLFYEDGGNPTEAILQSFLKLCESESGAIAVHCKAGLGRTGTCIGAYLMKHYGFTAREAIGWMRVCRPGSVIGPQQQYLESIEPRMWDEGAAFRRTRRLPQPVAGSLLARVQNTSAPAASMP